MSSPTCYAIDGGVYNDSFYGAKPCGTKDNPGLYDPESGFQSCCLYDDECGANNICKWASNSPASEPALGSGYYLGGCTDPTFETPMCRNNCKKFTGQSDIVYVRDGVWACCAKTTDGSNQPNCSSFLDDQAYDLGWSVDQFPGPIDTTYTPAATTSIAEVASSSTIASSSSTSTASTTTSAAPSNTAETHSPNSAGLTTGARAGIGVGVSIGLLVLIAGGIVFALRRKRQKATQGRSTIGYSTIVKPGTGEAVEVMELEGEESTRHEMSAVKPPRELQGVCRPHELEA